MSFISLENILQTHKLVRINVKIHTYSYEFKLKSTLLWTSFKNQFT